MIDLLVWFAIFVGSLIVLIKASDFFINAAERIGNFLKVPHIIIGVTVVSLGTSLPELASSIFAVLHGNSEIVAANVVGSNIANILLVLGISAIVIKKLKVTSELVRVDLIFLLGSAAFLGFTIFDGVFTLPEGLIFIAGIIIYYVYAVKSQKISDVHKLEKGFEDIKKKSKQLYIDFGIIILCSIFIFISAKYTIQSVLRLSELLNLATDIVAATVVALGTSIPELTVSIIAARRGNSEMAIGNVLGSNIFNIFGVMGIASLFGPLTIAPGVMAFQFPLMIVATFLYWVMVRRNKITIWDGCLLLLFYVFFIGKMFGIV